MRARKNPTWRSLSSTVLAAAVWALAMGAGPARGADEREFTKEFRIDDCTWAWFGDQNPYFSLRRGNQNVLEGEEENDEGGTTLVQAIITNLEQTKRITFRSATGKRITVIARVVEERESEDGELVEVSRNWFSRCVETGDIFYFGEEVDDYEDGEIVGHEGGWQAGRAGALPGLIMPGTFLLGSRYYQEQAPGVALDRGENTRMGLTVEVPAGTFHNCVEVIDTNELSPDSPGDAKIYCAGVGIVKDEDLELVERGRI
jgi:hypothetical protein